MIWLTRYIKELSNNNLIIESYPELHDLLKTQPYIKNIQPTFDSQTDCDYHISNLSLPAIWWQQHNQNPTTKTPYLTVPPQTTKHWQTKIKQTNKLKIGITWQGNPNHGRDQHRTIDLTKLTPLLNLPNTQYYSLQKNPTTKLPAKLIDLNPDLTNFLETAGAIENLDLIITIDTATAHLAGALNKPTWLLLPENADWRWQRKGTTTNWYPSMKLYRQQKQGEWEPVIEKIKQELQK